MAVRFPKTLQTGTGVLQASGPGKTMGTGAYFDVAAGRTVELYACRTIRTGGSGSHLLADNQAIPPITIPLPSTLGTMFLVELNFAGSGITARRWWQVQSPATPATAAVVKPASVHRGYIAAIDKQGRFVFIEDGTRRLFAHSSELRNIRMNVGAKVEFRIGPSPKGDGLVALNVVPAA